MDRPKPCKEQTKYNKPKDATPYPTISPFASIVAGGSSLLRLLLFLEDLGHDGKHGTAKGNVLMNPIMENFLSSCIIRWTGMYNLQNVVQAGCGEKVFVR